MYNDPRKKALIQRLRIVFHDVHKTMPNSFKVKQWGTFSNEQLNSLITTYESTIAKGVGNE